MKFTRRVAGIIFFSSLLIGVLTDTLARQSIFGLNFLAWTMLWVLILAIFGYQKKRLGRHFLPFTVLAVFNAVLVFVRADSIVQAWSVCITLVSLLILTGTMYAENFMRLTIHNRVMEYLGGSIGVIKTNFRQALTSLGGNRKQHKSIRISKGVIFAIILALIFIGLFSGSDAVFRHQFSFIGTFFSDIGDWLGHYDIGRIISIAFWVCFAIAALFTMVGRDKPVQPTPLKTKKFLTRNDPVIILATLCVVFGLFILIQVRYLFAGGALPDGLTYATYARRGYGELLIATMLASAVIYATIAWAKDITPSKAKSILSNTLVVLNGVVVLSAWKRLSLYESAYGWTMPRFVARMGLVCIMLGSVLLLLWVNRLLTSRHLFGYNWYIVAVVLTIAAMLNPVGIIASKNLTERASREVALDTGYLNSLSADGYRAICKYAPSLSKTHPSEYRQLRLTYTGKANHGLSAHYTLGEIFKHSYQGCL